MASRLRPVLLQLLTVLGEVPDASSLASIPCYSKLDNKMVQIVQILAAVEETALVTGLTHQVQIHQLQLFPHHPHLHQAHLLPVIDQRVSEIRLLISSILNALILSLEVHLMTVREIEMDDVSVLVVIVEEAQKAQNARGIQRESLRSIVIDGHLNVENPRERDIQHDHRQLVISSQVEIMELPVMLLETLAETMLESQSETVAEMSSEKAVEIVSGKAIESLADVMEESGNLSEIHTMVHGM
jgi:hypothetical protein